MEPTVPRRVSRGPRLTAGEAYRRARTVGHAVDLDGADPQRRGLRYYSAPSPNPVPSAGPVSTRSTRRRATSHAVAPQAVRRAKAPASRAVRAVRATAGFATVCLLLLTGFAWNEIHQFDNGLNSSRALGDTPRSADAAENILLMGLDTRKDQNGDDLSPEILKALHAGDSSDGGYNTNTLILVHIPADRQKIVAYSIPRDDLVTMHGLDVPNAKIKEAYGRAKAKTEQQLIDSGVTDQKKLETQSREAGRASTIRAVRDLTGVPIDRFAEVSLAGFYDVAQALGGVTVCLNHAVSDRYSGARFPAGRQHLSASQAVSFVRQRHGLDNGDLDRTRRQQAFLVSALHQVQSAGTFTDVSKLHALIDVLHRDVVVSSGWDLLDWAQNMASVDGQSFHFTTLPVERYSTYDGESVNIIDADQIRATVQRAFGVPLTSPSTTDSSASSTDATPQPTSSATGSSTSSAPTPTNVDQGTAIRADADIPCVD